MCNQRSCNADTNPEPAWEQVGARNSIGLTPLGLKTKSQTNTPGYASLPKLSLSPAGSWLQNTYNL